MENLSYEGIFKKYGTLELLGDALDSCYDLYSLGYVNGETQNRYVHLSEQSFLTIWAVWQYFNGNKSDKENYQHTYDMLIKREES